MYIEKGEEVLVNCNCMSDDGENVRVGCCRIVRFSLCFRLESIGLVMLEDSIKREVAQVLPGEYNRPSSRTVCYPVSNRNGCERRSNAGDLMPSNRGPLVWKQSLTNNK